MNEHEKITIKTIAAELGADPARLVPSAHLVRDLRADSLDRVSLVMALEEAHGIEIPDETAERCHTVGDCHAAIAASLAPR